MTSSYKIGDSLQVRTGVKDADFGHDISGWQGRITKIDESEDGFVSLLWAAPTAKFSSPSVICKTLLAQRTNI